MTKSNIIGRVRRLGRPHFSRIADAVDPYLIDVSSKFLNYLFSVSSQKDVEKKSRSGFQPLETHAARCRVYWLPRIFEMTLFFAFFFWCLPPATFAGPPSPEAAEIIDSAPASIVEASLQKETSIPDLYKSLQNFNFRLDKVMDLSSPALAPILEKGKDVDSFPPHYDKKVPVAVLWAVAFVKNPDLRSMREMVRSRAEMYPQTMYVDALAAQYRSFIKGINTRTTSGGMNGGMELLFPGPGVLTFNGRLARLEVDMAMEDYAMKLRDVGAEIFSMAAERESFRESIVVLTETIQVISAFEASLKSRFSTDKAMYPELARLQAERERMINERNSMKRMFEAMLPALNRYLGRSPESPLGVIEIPGFSDTADSRKIAGSASEARQEIRIQKVQIDILKTLSALKHRTTLNPISPGFAYVKDNMQESKGSGNSMGMGKNAPDPLSSYRQSFETNPVTQRAPDFGGPVAYLREIDRRIDAESARLIELQNGLQSDLALTHSELRNARQSAFTERSRVVPSLKRGLESASSGYRTGNVSFLEWMELFMKMLESKMSAVRYEMLARKALAKLMMLAGTLNL